MSQSALPVTTGPRTITVRVRTVAIGAVVAAAIGLVWWALAWANGMQPLSAGAWSNGANGLPVVGYMPSALGSGPTAYRWRAGGIYTVRIEFHNGASVPITITGVDHSTADWGGPLAGPTLQNATRNFVLLPGPFHDVRIPADGDRFVGFVFHANPRTPCSGGSVMTMDSVNVHFTALGVFHDTQMIPLTDAAAVMKGRTC